MNRLMVCATVAMLAAAPLVSAQDRVPLPAVTGPVPATETSHPFLDSHHVLEPVDLAAVGYVEEEYFVSGAANVYDWPRDGALTVRTPAAPYTTRILVRRPRDAAKFTGAVLVELMYTPRRWDWPMMWGFMRDQLLARGDAWVGITMPGAVAGLQKFDPMRYASLSFKNPSNVACGAAPTPAPTEDGLKWDVISQVGALLKSGAAGTPFRGTTPSLYLSVQGGDLTTYMNAIHRRARLDKGRPVYDGYLARAPFAATRINQCAQAPAANDSRQTIAHLDVPVIAVAAQGDLPNTFAFRRDDSDAPGDRYRLYEIAGAAHIDRFAYTGFPSMRDQEAAGSAQGSAEWPFAMPCTPPIPMMSVPILSTVYDAAFVNLDAWSRRGTAPPRAPRLTATAAEAGKVSVATDASGHGLGGVRTPYVEVPIATYTTGSIGPAVCTEMGTATPFDAARVASTYGSFENYAAKVNAAIKRQHDERWLTDFDAKRLRMELIDAQRARLK
jgi:hypothetical protein